FGIAVAYASESPSKPDFGDGCDRSLRSIRQISTRAVSRQSTRVRMLVHPALPASAVSERLRIEPTAIPTQKSIPKKHPAYRAKRQIRSKRQLCCPNTLPHDERDQADNRNEKAAGANTE